MPHQSSSPRRAAPVRIRGRSRAVAETDASRHAQTARARKVVWWQARRRFVYSSIMRGDFSGAAGGGHGSLRGEEERRKEGRRRRGDPLPGAAGSRVQAPEPPAPPALMPLRPPLQPRSWAPIGRRRPTTGRRRDLRADAGTCRWTPPVSRGRAPAATARRAHADPRAAAAASPSLEEGRARTLEPRPGGSPAPWKQPLPAPEPGVVASPPLWCFCSRRR